MGSKIFENIILPKDTGIVFFCINEKRDSLQNEIPYYYK